MSRLRIAIIITGTVFLLSCSSHQKNCADPRYELATAKKESLGATIKIPAQLAAYLEVNISPKANGYVTRH